MTQQNHGLRWLKLDLHVHTPASADYVGTISAEEFVSRTIARGIHGIAVTDHNTGAWVDKLKAAAKGTGLTVFPGVELTVAGGKAGVHLLALFPLEATTKSIEHLLAKMDFPSDQYGSLDAVSPKSPEDALQIIAEEGALAILAHADSSKGVMNDMSGQQRIRTMNSPYLAAVEIKHIKKTSPLLSGEDPHFRRRLAYYRASDNRTPITDDGHSIDGVGARFSWFKMDGCTHEGLKQCFLDPDVRIITDEGSDLVPDRLYPRILAISASQGFLAKIEFEFHEGLNSIIGGKGVGKSLLVELIRFALDQPSPVETIEQDMESKLNAQLGTGGIVTATIQLEADQVLIVERRYDGASNPMKVFYRESGNSFKGNLGELFPILAYSQTEALEIAKDNSAQLRLIDGLLDLASIDARVSAIRTELRTLDVNVAACSLAEDEIDGRQRALATNEEKIAQLDKSLASAEHLVLQQLKPKTDCFTKIDRFVEEIEEAVEGISESIGGCSLPKLPKDFESDSELQTLLSDLDADAKKLKANAKVLESAVTKLAKKARSAALSWDDVVAKKRKQYEEWVRAQGGDKTALLTQKDRLEKERTALRKAVHTLQKQIDGVPKLKTARDQLLVELASESSRRFELRRRKYEELTLASGGRLDLQITASANRSDYLDELTVLKTGSHLQDATIRSVCDTVLPAELVALVLQNDGSTLAKRASITTALANKLVGHLVAHADRRRILALEHEDIVHDGPVIRYRKDDGNFYDLAQLSIGQKCTALLIIALAEGTRPIVIDQPEDALDITSVYQDVTLQIRERKSNRQFILTTHNPTVAVASDTDRYHVLTASASQALLATHGAMDRPVVKDAVIQHLEGGTASFSLKTRKYGMKIS